MEAPGYLVTVSLLVNHGLNFCSFVAYFSISLRPLLRVLSLNVALASLTCDLTSISSPSFYFDFPSLATPNLDHVVYKYQEICSEGRKHQGFRPDNQTLPP